MECPSVAIFDLDGTLSPAFTPPEDGLIRLLAELSKHVPFSIMSAATFERIERDVLSRLPAEARAPFVFPLNGAQCRMYQNGEWAVRYDFSFTDEDVEKIKVALIKVSAESGILRDIAPHGPQIIDYKGYLAFTALGTDASRPEKEVWDPDASKRLELLSAIQQSLPEYEVYIGGRTTIDIIPKGRNKGFAVRWLAEYLHTKPNAMLFIGDGLGEGGNDAVVIPTGVRTMAVNGPDDTVKIIEEIIRSCGAHS